MVEVSPYLLRSTIPATARRVRPDTFEQTDDDSLLRQIGRTAISGAQIIGNTLNKPSRALWGTANALFGGDSGGGLLNLIPFSDTMGLTNADEGIELSEFLTNRGVLAPDKEGLDWGDVPRIAFDIVGDPLSWLTPLPLTKAGTAAFKGGKLSKGFANQIGRGERALIGFNAPLELARFGTAGTGQQLEGVGRAIDTGVDKALYGNIPGTNISPGRTLSSMFDPKTRGRSTEPVQRASRAEFDNFKRNQQEFQSAINAAVTWAYRNKATDVADAARQRAIAEGVFGPAQAKSAEEYQIFSGLGQMAKQIGQFEDASGAQRIGDLLDVIEYFPRSARRGSYVSLPGSEFGKMTKGDKRRNEVFKGFASGSGGVNMVLTDPASTKFVKDTVNSGIPLTGQYRQASIDALANHLRAKFSNEIVVPTYKRTVNRGGQKVEIDVDRFREMAKFMLKHPDDVGKPMFNTNPLVDLSNRANTSARRMFNAKVARQAIAASASPTGDGVKVSDLVRDLGLNKDILARDIASKFGGSAKNTKDVLKYRVPDDVARDLLRPTLTPSTGPLRAIQRGAESFNSLFKAGVLTNPSRYVRDLTSGTLRNVREGAMSVPAARGAGDIVFGGSGASANLDSIPAVQQWLQSTNRAVTPENAADAVREMYASFGSNQNLYRDNIGDAAASFKDLADRLPGLQGETFGQRATRVGQTMVGRDGGATFGERMNPINIRGVGDRKETTFGLAAAGDIVGNTTDELNRMTPFIERLRQGFEPGQARKLTDRAQVDYSNDNFTPFERELSTIFPFYRFMSRQLPYVATELASNPGGRLAQTIGATGDLQTSDPFTPDYIGQSTAIPLSIGDDGTRSYLTGLGLMHEDPLSFIGGGVRGALAEGISRTSPLIKAPIEWASGESFFQRGPEGGRELGDMDPTIGRTLTNIGQMTGLTDSNEPVRFPGSQGVEFLAGNSPLSRVFTTARQLTDQRPAATADKKLLNTLTGARVTNVSPATRDAIIRELTQAFAKERGAKDFRMVRFTKAQIAEMKKTDPAQAEVAEAINRIMTQLSQRAKDRQSATAR